MSLVYWDAMLSFISWKGILSSGRAFDRFTAKWFGGVIRSAPARSLLVKFW